MVTAPQPWKEISSTKHYRELFKVRANTESFRQEF